MRRLLVLSLLASMAACSSSPSDVPPEAEPAVAAARAAASEPAAASEVAAAPEAEPASYDLDTCLPASLRGLDATFDETARVERAGVAFVLLEAVSRTASRVEIANSFRPVLLRVEADACESLLPEQTDAFDIGNHVSEADEAALYLQNTEWKAGRVGGLDAYVAFLLPDGAETLVECADDDDLGFCVMPPRAEALRTLGVTVSL